MIDPAPDRDETTAERADRNMGELLQELRVALPGVQVLFAFLLTVPFAQRFVDGVTPFQEKAYFVTLLCSAVASAFLTAPAAYHRLNFARGDKPHVVAVASRLATVGLVALAFAMTGAVTLVTDVLFGTTLVVVAAGGSALLFAVLWFALPLWRRFGPGSRERFERQRARGSGAGVSAG